MSIEPFDPSEHPHRRYNPLMGTHVLVSPHRTKRPWKGQVDIPKTVTLPQHEKECYLCPGNRRMNDEVNPNFEHTYVFQNDFPALLPPPLPTANPTASAPSSSSFFASEPTFGSCKVLTYSPRHDLTLALMSVPDIREVVRCWAETYLSEGAHIRAGHKEVGGEEDGCVTIFENRGSMMGASAPHPHGQVWSTSFVPQEPATELSRLAAYRESSSADSCLLCDYAQQEVSVSDRERIVCIDEEGGWVAVTPFWAVWPFEIMLLPYKRHISSLVSLTEAEAVGLARIMKSVLTRYDNLFQTSFPYSMGIHQRPLPPQNEREEQESPAHLHIHFYPPLLRSASVRKFLVGFEMMGEAQRDLTPEQAAQRLRDVSEVHYTESQKQGV